MPSKPRLVLKYTFDYTGSHSQQTDVLAIATDTKTGKNVSAAQYALFRKGIHINYIETLPQYRMLGVASRMIARIKREHPGYKLHPDITTDDGTQLFAAIGQKRKAATKKRISPARRR